MITAETERLILRIYRQEDLQDLYEYLSDQEVVEYEPYKPLAFDDTKENLQLQQAFLEITGNIRLPEGSLFQKERILLERRARKSYLERYLCLCQIKWRHLSAGRRILHCCVTGS